MNNKLQTLIKYLLWSQVIQHTLSAMAWGLALEGDRWLWWSRGVAGFIFLGFLGIIYTLENQKSK